MKRILYSRAAIISASSDGETNLSAFRFGFSCGSHRITRSTSVQLQIWPVIENTPITFKPQHRYIINAEPPNKKYAKPSTY